MGLIEAQWAMAAVAAASAVSTNVQANRANHKKPNKTAIQAPDSTVLKDKEEEEVNLGSDRAKDKGKRSLGKRQLMQPQTSNSTGLQI